jgi:Tfp pilus assembly protein PilF
MRNRLKVAALVASLFAGALLCSTSMAADSGPQPSKSVIKPLKAAQDALAQKKYDEALSHIREAQNAPGEKTAYDTWVINVLTLQIYQQKQDIGALMPVLANMAQSQYATAEQQKVWFKSLAQYSFQQKDYPKAIDYAEQAEKHGSTDSDTVLLVAKAEYLAGKYKDAATTLQDLVSKEEKPDEESLKMMWQFDLKANDESGAAKAVEKLVAYYPKPEYWQNALAPLERMDIKDEHVKLDAYRLKSDVGVMHLPSDYAEMAEIAFDVGYPGLTQTVLQEAFSKNIFTDQRDKDRYQHLLDGAKQRAAADQAQLPMQEKQADSAATGDALVQVGAAYLSYGQLDKAVASIGRGISKGGLKSPEEANLLLGIAQLKMKNTAEAEHSFDKVASSSNMAYARLGRLWALHAGQHLS